MRLFAALAPLALTLVSGCGAPETLEVENAWARLPAASGRPGAAYFELEGGASATALIAVESAAADRAELHEMANDNGVMRMSAVRSIAVPANGDVALAPGGLHVMLFGLRAGLQPGGIIPLTLHFADGQQITAEAKLVGAGDPAP